MCVCVFFLYNVCLLLGEKSFPKAIVAARSHEGNVVTDGRFAFIICVTNKRVFTKEQRSVKVGQIKVVSVLLSWSLWTAVISDESRAQSVFTCWLCVESP